MKVNKILETCLYVNDLEEAEHFYSDVLGLKPFAKQAKRHVFFRCRDAVFLLFKACKTRELNQEVPSHGTDGEGHVAFAISEHDFDDWKDHLLKKEVIIEKEIDWQNGGRSIYFRDPSGNSIELATPAIWGIEDSE